MNLSAFMPQGALALAMGLLAALGPSAVADSVTPKSADPSVAAELASFKLHEDFEASLFADETLGIANPIAMHWDSQGRLWVLTTLAYAQLAPGERPDDKLYILEDRDGDNRADHASIFVGGLDMPTGFALGDGGVYLAEGGKLLFLGDSDGDGAADSRRVLLSGFGTGDTHQNISNLTWGPDGCLYFCQGLHTFSRVETPWGIVRGDTAGFFRFDPRLLKLEPFCFPSLASQNPCGIGFDRRGAMFLKSNNKELIFVTPGLVPTTYQRNLVPVASVGATPGKSMAAEYVESAHLPDWLQGHMLIAGYYSHRVTAFPLIEDGSGYQRVEPVELLVAGHSSFRPVEVRIGPDGAIYVADWFNPIIGHYQASLRHPDRDKQHGRIWRITAKGRPLMEEMPLQLKRQPWLTERPGVIAEVRDFGELEPFQRLQQVIGLANRPQADSLALALQVLDHQPDRFIDYALRQTVQALSEHWLPALKAGELKFDMPDHLAFALEVYGGPEAVGLVREKLGDETLDSELRQTFARVLARVGNADDLRELLTREHADDAVLRALIDSWPTRKVRAAPPFAPRLKQLMESDHQSVRLAAIRLAGLWQVKPLADTAAALAYDPQQEVALRIDALRSVALLRGKNASDSLAEIADNSEAAIELRRGAIAALSLVDLPVAARSAAALLAVTESDAAANALLAPFLNRKGGVDALAAGLESASVNAAAAGHLANAMSAIGRSDASLAKVIDTARGVAPGHLDYSADLVAELVAEVKENGDAAAGRAVFQKVELSCIACHQVRGVGGILGPSLDTVGAGLPLDLIVESVLWPDRQLKEGYFALGVTTKDGRVFAGYQDREQSGVLYLKDTATGQTQPIPLGEIAERKNIGTLMPAGLTASLERNELRDLVAYLASLKGGE